MPASRSGPSARHEDPAVDEAALAAARHADLLLDAVRSAGSERWTAFLAPLPDRLRDEPTEALRAIALRARAAFGPKDSIRDVLPDELTMPFRDAVDSLIKTLGRRAHRTD